MSRFNHGLTSGEDLFERPPSEGGNQYLESGSDQSASEDQSSIHNYRRVCRAIIVQACRDLGSGIAADLEEIGDWIQTEQFEMLCEFSGWDDAWVRDMFTGMISLRPNVRCEISKQCGKILRMISNLQRD